MTKEQALKIYMETDVKTECSLCQKRILKQIDTDFVSIIEDILKHIRIFYKGIVDKQQKKRTTTCQLYTVFFFNVRYKTKKSTDFNGSFAC